MRPVDVRFWEKVEKSDGCWLWRAWVTKDGYGGFRWTTGENMRAHRAAYRLLHGDVPADVVICHHCDNPLCVRPDHLYAGTATDNNRDTVRRGRRNPTRKTHCPHGHAYTPENTYRHVRGDGKIGVRCRTCLRVERERTREQRLAYFAEWRRRQKVGRQPAA
jgi:hypothetical protein